MDLKLRLTLRVAALALLSLLGAKLYATVAARSDERVFAGHVARVAAQALTLQQEQSRWVRPLVRLSPGLSGIASSLEKPGLCVSFRDAHGHVAQQICNATTQTPPSPLVSLYLALFPAPIVASAAVAMEGQNAGEAVASLEARDAATRVLHEAGRVASVLSMSLLLLCVFVYVALATALRPTRAISAGLARLANGDLSARLPPFDLAELSAIGHVFNQMATQLESTLAERAALTRRLIQVQDDERRALASDLHDEFGQCLTAISAMSASVAQGAAAQSPELEPECHMIGQTAARMMDALRGALLRLRPPDLDTLGLRASLEGLIASWNNMSAIPTRFAISFAGDLAPIGKDTAEAIYRIVQEAITNALRHACASSVSICLRVSSMSQECAMPAVILDVADDGAVALPPSSGARFGLLIIRERVTALGGTVQLGASGSQTLHVAIPLATRGDDITVLEQ